MVFIAAFVVVFSVSGGELFDRIIDENYTLMELDAVTFIRQICEGLQHMHKMYILHLDLKVTTLLVVLDILVIDYFEGIVKKKNSLKNFSQKISFA